MSSQATCIIFAIIITLAGVWMRWRLPAFEMDAEDHLKDGKLTAQQIENRIRWVRDGGRLLTLTGMGLLGACLVLMNT